MRFQAVIVELIFSAFDGFMGRKLEATIWMFFKCQLDSYVQKSVSQLD